MHVLYVHITTVTAPSPIDTQILHYEVTFSAEITPILHINFTVSEKKLCAHTYLYYYKEIKS